ncbi:hypothetical protein K488DRAFT_73069 [Vararia minispora EC-137]|uniref:Uncharacterized protein n=1 Tax=Vararia minispora EC-137 TaxID=1314806 RepID=A0ACB8QCE0_9AGAM|nr:hypothetical protein K488DRAFT_73069 [Vararia minispora EC-137]
MAHIPGHLALSVAAISSAFLLLLVFTASVLRKTWSLPVIILCRRLNLWIDFGIALGIPALVTGALSRIILELLRHNQTLHSFLADYERMPRPRFYRIFVIGCIDVIATLPIGLYAVIDVVRDVVETSRRTGVNIFYHSWATVHDDWGPISVPYHSLPTRTLVRINLEAWMAVFFAILIFALFGLTEPVRAIYWRGIGTAVAVVGWRLPGREDESLDDMAFATNQNISDAERGTSKTTVVVTVSPASSGARSSYPSEPKLYQSSDESSDPDDAAGIAYMSPSP